MYSLSFSPSVKTYLVLGRRVGGPERKFLCVTLCGKTCFSLVTEFHYDLEFKEIILCIRGGGEGRRYSYIRTT